MRIIVFDGNSLASKEAFGDAYEAQTDPEAEPGFGRNLDALNDSLWGGPGCPGRCKVVIRNGRKLAATMGRQWYENLLEILREADDVNLAVK
ncbi:barstar family protein [Hymenobacter sp. B81]|uniref:barstar family protein n=1 Tax=Hymenobacter sp. B81 TaxID=3344878 RepID=UPI0037DD0AF1